MGTGIHRGYECIIFEVCQGTLCDVISGRYDLNPLPARHVLEMSYQLVKGVECELFLRLFQHITDSETLQICTP